MQFGDWEEGHKMTEGFATMRADLTEKTSRDLLYGVKCGCLFWYRGTRQHQSPQPEPGATPMAATFFSPLSKCTSSLIHLDHCYPCLSTHLV